MLPARLGATTRVYTDGEIAKASILAMIQISRQKIKTQKTDTPTYPKVPGIQEQYTHIEYFTKTQASCQGLPSETTVRNNIYMIDPRHRLLQDSKIIEIKININIKHLTSQDLISK